MTKNLYHVDSFYSSIILRNMTFVSIIWFLWALDFAICWGVSCFEFRVRYFRYLIFTGSGMNKCIKDEMKKYHSSLGFFVAFILLNLVLIIVFCEFVCLFVFINDFVSFSITYEFWMSLSNTPLQPDNVIIDVASQEGALNPTDIWQQFDPTNLKVFISNFIWCFCVLGGIIPLICIQQSLVFACVKNKLLLINILLSFV